MSSKKKRFWLDLIAFSIGFFAALFTPLLPNGIEIRTWTASVLSLVLAILAIWYFSNKNRSGKE